MEMGPWVTIGIFIFTQAISMVWVIATNKAETQVLRTELITLQREMQKLANVLVLLAEQKGEMKLTQERQLLQGSRIDELTKRVNHWIDKGLETKE